MTGNSGFLKADDGHGPYMQTHSGVHFHLLRPVADEVRLMDIAHALSRIPRFTGHTHGPHAYSVAQHSVWVAEEVAPEMALVGLLHDAHEAYIGDISTPVAHALNKIGWEVGFQSPIAILKVAIQTAIHEKFHLPWPPPLSVSLAVHEADVRALEFERALVMDGTSQVALPPEEAKRLFLDVFRWSGGYRVWP